jgi:hypothetical protein
MLAVVVAEGVAIALLGVLVLGLLRSHALILRALHELGAGLELERGGPAASAAGPVPVDLDTGIMPATRVPTVAGVQISGSTLDGDEVTIPVAGADRRTLIAFLSSGCAVCQTFWSELSSGVPAVPGDGRLLVVAKGPEAESQSSLRELAGELEVVQSSQAWADYGVPGSPYFVYVEDGVITGEGSSTSWAQVRDLMSQAVADSALARRRAGRTGPGPLGPPSGTPGPNLRDGSWADRELLGAGIHPGHASLYEAPGTGDDETSPAP